jgi:hypothetical protein
LCDLASSQLRRIAQINIEFVPIGIRLAIATTAAKFFELESRDVPGQRFRVVSCGNRKDPVVSLGEVSGAHSKSAHTENAAVSIQSQQNRRPTPALSHQFLLSCLANVSLPRSVVRAPIFGPKMDDIQAA